MTQRKQNQKTKEKKRVLIYGERPPLTKRASGDIRFFQIIACLSEKYTVTFVTIPVWHKLSNSDDEVDQSLNDLKSCNCEVRFDLADTIRKNKYDLIFFEFFDSAFKFIDDARFFQPTAQIVVDSVDLHYRRLEKLAQVDRSISSRLRAYYTKRIEIATYKRADAIIVVSPEDEDSLRKILSAQRIVLTTNIIRVPDLLPRTCGGSPNLLFVGGFKHAPNIDSVLYFHAEIWPILKNKTQNLTVTIVGENPPESISTLNSEEFRIMGWLPDLSEVYKNADISIAPLRWGGGIKGKVGEAMAQSLPVVTTSVGAEGFSAIHNKHLIVADSATEFAEAIDKLIRDPEFYSRVQKSANLFMSEKFSPETIRTNLLVSIDEILSQTPRKIKPFKWLKTRLRTILMQHVAWRFSSAQR